MKRRNSVFIISLLLTALILTACAGHPVPPPGASPDAATPGLSAVKQSPGPMAWPVYDDTDRTRYTIDLTFDEESHTAAATQRVTYVNTSQDTMDILYMHIYPKHFSKQEYVSMCFIRPDQAVYPDDAFNPGDITLTSVKADGRAVDYSIGGEDETILHIPLEISLAPGQMIELDIAYTLQVPHRMGRFAWGDTGTNFANWYPVMAVYDDEGWNLDPYYEIGDPFYSETADYRVTIDMPAGIEAAFTGDVLGDATSEGRRVLSLGETGVRDFAFVLSPDYIIEESMVDGVTVRVAMPGKGMNMMDLVMGIAVDSVSTYNRKFGRYINDTLTVAFVDDYSGMEYPGIVFIGRDLLSITKGTVTLSTTITHEIAHQWWYSAVGNDEIDEPWLDESLTSFTTLVYRRENGISDYWQDPDEIQPDEGRVLKESLGDYEGWDDYTYIYSFGQFFFVKLMRILGEDTFYRMLQQYYAQYAYGVATTEDLRALVADTGNTEALKWFDLCVYGK